MSEHLSHPDQETPRSGWSTWSSAGKVWLGWWIVWAALSVLGLVVALAFVTAPLLLGVGLASLLLFLITGAAWLTWYLERQRMLAMADACRLMDFTFTEKPAKNDLKAFDYLPVFKQGRGNTARNRMDGRVGDCDVTVMDLRFVTGSGKNSHTWKQTVVVLPDGGGGLPDFQLCPENFLHRLGRLFGMQDLNFAEHPEFSKRYLLRGKDEAAVRAAFTAELLEFLTENPGGWVDVQNGTLVVYRKGKTEKPEAVPELVAHALRIQRMLAAGGEGEAPETEDAK